MSGLFAIMSVFGGCSDDNTSDNFRLDGDCWLASLKLDEYEGVINNENMTVTVGVPVVPLDEWMRTPSSRMLPATSPKG